MVSHMAYSRLQEMEYLFVDAVQAVSVQEVCTKRVG